MILKITDEDVGLRLDKFLQKNYPDKTRSHIKHWIDDEIVLVNGNGVKAGYIIKINDNIEVEKVEEKVLSAEPQDIPIDILYEDEDLAIINKPQGMVVHPAVKNYDGTLVNALMYKLKSLAGGSRVPLQR